MGGTSACCVEKDPIYDAKLSEEASIKSNIARSSKSIIKYKHVDNEIENEIENEINGISSSIDHSQNRKRGSIIHIADNDKTSEDKNNYENDKKLSKDIGSRDSYESDDDGDNNSGDQIFENNNNNNHSMSTQKTHHSQKRIIKEKKRHHRHHHHHKRRSYHKNKKSKSKSKNQLVYALKECIKEFNKSMQSISLLQLMSTNQNDHQQIYDQNELLDIDIICKYFKMKKYNIKWFLMTKRNKFIKIIVNKWNNISILTSIRLYDMLSDKISKMESTISTSSLNLGLNTITNRNNNNNLQKRKRRSTPENIMFTWRENVDEIKDCNNQHLLYIISLVIKQLNQEILKSNHHATNSMNIRKPLYHQMDLLSYLLQIQIDGYLFRGLNKNVFILNIQRFVIDFENISSSSNINMNEIQEKYSIQYASNLHTKIDQFEISKIYKQSTCTIEFTLSNSKRWESVSSLIKTMKVSEYNVDLAIDDDDDDDDDDQQSSSSDCDDDNSSQTVLSDDDDEKQREPDFKLKGSINISDQMQHLRKIKDTLDTNQYIEKMEILQQKLADSLKNDK